MIKVLDETGQVAEGELKQFGRVTAMVVDGRILLPGAFTLLADHEVESLSRLMAISDKVASTPGIWDQVRSTRTGKD